MTFSSLFTTALIALLLSGCIESKTNKKVSSSTQQSTSKSTSAVVVGAIGSNTGEALPRKAVSTDSVIEYYIIYKIFNSDGILIYKNYYNDLPNLKEEELTTWFIGHVFESKKVEGHCAWKISKWATLQKGTHSILSKTTLPLIT